jgi:hypothetical protein
MQSWSDEPLGWVFDNLKAQLQNFCAFELPGISIKAAHERSPFSSGLHILFSKDRH